MLELTDRQPLLVFGGPYSNLEATRAVRAVADGLAIPPSHVLCTGDVVAYGAHPEETARLVAGWGCHVVQGNCEQQLAKRAADCGCNFAEGTTCANLAKGWYPFADAHISDAMRDWMGTLPVSLRFRYGGLGFLVVHGGTSVVNRWVFGSNSVVLDEELAAAGADVVIAGHCGLPFVARRRFGTWFNPGVIGLPANDGTPDVWYGLIRSTSRGVVLSTHRLAYDYPAAAAAMRRKGHANGYARTLVTGLWPSLDILPEAERMASGRPLRTQKVTVALAKTERAERANSAPS